MKTASPAAAGTCDTASWADDLGAALVTWQTGLTGFLAGLLIALVTTPAGVSGEVSLLPVQLSVLHVPSPAVTPTNSLFNIVAVPGALLRYRRSGHRPGDRDRPGRPGRHVPDLDRGRGRCDGARRLNLSTAPAVPDLG